ARKSEKQVQATGDRHAGLRPRGDTQTSPELVQIVAPPLMHRDPLLPIEAPIVSPANGIRIGMGERAFDRVWTPLAALIEQGGCRRAQTVRGDLAGRVSHSPKRLVDRVLAHRP